MERKVRVEPKMTERPIEYCYWVVPGELLAGEYPRNIDAASSLLKIKALLGAGVSAFIDLTEENDGLSPYSSMIGAASYQRFPVKDVSLPRSAGETVAILDAIDYHIGQGHIVYVHCWGGIGRTGTIIGCWLARHGCGGRPALDRLKELWKQCPKSADRESPETGEQEQYILNWDESL